MPLGKKAKVIPPKPDMNGTQTSSLQLKIDLSNFLDQKPLL
jgi:hypothetical protein